MLTQSLFRSLLDLQKLNQYLMRITNSKEYYQYLYTMEAEKETQIEQARRSSDETVVERPKDDITWSVMQDLAARAAKGYVKYNTTLQENNHQNMLQHGYEEALDLAQYLKKEITTLNTIQDLVQQYSNDEELGRKVRELYRPNHG